MASRRSLIALLCAVFAMLAVPAAASAAAPSGWRTIGLSLGNLTPIPSACASLATPTGGPDVTPPTDQTIAPPTMWSTSSLNVVLTATDDTGVTGFEWSVDGAPWVGAPNGATINVADEGAHTLETCVFDADGNFDGSTFNYQIDDQLPVDQTDSGSLSWSQTGRTVTVTGSDAVSGVDHVEWELDGQGVHSVPNNTGVPIVSDGAHTLRTRVFDVAGNHTNWVDHTVRIDGTAPVDTTAAPGAWQTTAYTLTVTGTDAASGVAQVDYKVDSGTDNIVAAPASVVISADGVHTIHTRVQDTAGNWTGFKDTIVRIDTTAPTNQTPAGPGASVWIATDYAVVLSGADGGSGVQQVDWRVDGGPITSGPSGSTQATVTGTGPHTLETRVLDNAGNGNWRSETINIDKVAPANTTTVPSSAVPTPASIAITGTDAHSGIAYVEWTVDGGQLHSTTDLSSATATADTNGPHTLWSRVVDNAGNATVSTGTFTIDTTLNNDSTPPTDTTETVSAGWYVEPTTVTIAATDAGVGVNAVQWRLPGQPIETRTGASFDLAFNTEGVYKLETRGRDFAGNYSPWRLQIVRLDFTVPVDTTTFSTDWQTSRTFAWSATDELSKPATIEYIIDNGSLQTRAVGGLIDFVTDGTHTIDHRVLDGAGQSSEWSTQTVQIDSVDPANTSAIPSSAWSATPVSVALSGTDTSPGSGFDTVEWRLGDDGDIHSGTTALIDTDGDYDLQTRAVDVAGRTSAWRHDPVKVDLTAPTNTTPVPDAGWRSTPYSVTASGDDGAGSGVATIDVKVDGVTVAGPGATVSTDGVHTIETRITDGVNKDSGWRTDTVQIDSVDPSATLTCTGGSGWSVSVSCTPTADGGPSGLDELTLATDGGTPHPVTSGGAVPVTANGAHTLTLTAVDGAGNEKTAIAQVHVDSSAPTASLSCAAAATPTGYTCRASGADGQSGLASLSYSLNGGAWTPVPATGTFPVASGTVRVRAIDGVGRQGLTAVLTLPVRVPPAPPAPPVTLRTKSSPVYLAGHHNDDAMVGAIVAARSATGTVSVDLRPLAVGRGRYQVVITLKSGKHKRTVKKTQMVGRGGTLRRIAASLAGASGKTTVSLTVRKRHGHKWRSHATAKVVLAK